MAALSAVKLPKYKAENVEFRMIYLVGETGFSTEYVDKSVPLFLGTDIICHSAVDPKNYCRNHMRYSKKGLASKICFKDKRVDGISNGNTLWFYSVQGMFKLIFECCNENVQMICLKHYTETWLDYQGSKPLPESLTLTMYQHECPVIQEQEVVIISQPENEIRINQSVPEAVGKYANITKHVDHNTVVTDDKVEAGKIEQSAHCDVTSLLISSSEEIDNFVNSICSQFNNKQDFDFDDRGLYFISLMRLYQLEWIISESDMSKFPMDLIDEYIDQVGKNTSLPSSNAYNLDRKLEILLDVISAWLGNMFSKLQPGILSNVERFKKDHIGCIDNLPPPQSLVNQVFPQSMVTLFKNWMSQQKDCYQPEEPDSKRQRVDSDEAIEEPLYNVIQMALEFTNRSLITGVSHVVYSRLLHS